MCVSVRSRAAVGAALVLCLAVAPRVANAGPVLLVGFAEKNGTQLWLPGIGWRFPVALGERAERVGQSWRLSPRLLIEPSVAAIAGDASSIEAQLVPMLELRPRNERSWQPYGALGVGLAYTAVHGLRLGSELLFSDQVEAGIVTSTSSGHRLSLAYRFRHLSHAGLWARTNSGLNAHFLVLSLE